MAVSIGDYAIIGDCLSAALVGRDGSIDWLCWPRFDSRSLFAALLDERRGGRFRVAPTTPARVTRRYLEGTNVLETRFDGAGGALVLTDLMPVASRDEERGRLLPGHEVLRRAECVSGEVEVEVRYEPRPGYGGRAARLRDHRALGLRADCNGGELV